MQPQDLIVIGAGPAGLSAGIYSACFTLNTLILEEKIPGGLATEIPLLENYPGLRDGISGMSFIDNMVVQCKKPGTQIHELEKVVELDLGAKIKTIKTNKSTYTARAIIIASGRAPKMLGGPGEEEFRGRGVSYCAVCDSFFFKGKKVTIVGEGNQAAEVAVYLSGLASSVTLVCPQHKLEGEKIYMEMLGKQKVEILTNTELKEIKGDMTVKSVVLFDKGCGDMKEMGTDGVFFQLEEKPNSQLARESGVEVNEDGFIIVDGMGRTNIDGVYCAGDITSCPIKQVVTAVSQGATAAKSVSEYITSNF